METNLTKKIKQACHSFRPALNSNMRTIRYADEVATPTGFVDVIRFEEYKSGEIPYCKLLHYKELYGENSLFKNIYKEQVGSCKKGSDFPFPNEFCKNCMWKTSGYQLDILVTCYEVKISVSDFKSKNGHNFHGNLNYYAVDSRIYDKIKSLVPKDIGIIVYYENSGQMRVKKESAFKELSSEEKERLLFDALKKWVDGKQK